MTENTKAWEDSLIGKGRRGGCTGKRAGEHKQRIRNYTFVDVISKHNKENWNSCSYISELRHTHVNVYEVVKPSVSKWFQDQMSTKGFCLWNLRDPLIYIKSDREDFLPYPQ
jgi:hypothetical protein